MMLNCRISRTLLVWECNLLYLPIDLGLIKNREKTVEAEILEKKQNLEFSKSIPKIFNWFYTNVVPKIKESIVEFWNCDINCRLTAIYDDSNSLFKGEEFFVTRIRPQEYKRYKDGIFFVKLSKDTVNMLLDNVLGERNQIFSFENLTAFEAKLLTEFNNFLGKLLNPLIVTNIDENRETFEHYNLMFCLKLPNGNTGKMLISIPDFMVKPEQIEIVEYDFDLDAFSKSTTSVDILVGTTKTSLNDLKHLEKDDIVVLENSRLNKMEMKLNGEVKTIKINPDPALIIDTDEQQHEDNNMEENTTKDMWDNIQVEIGAEFEKVKLTLGELRQITEGLVVDIGSVYENKIDLKVENKIVASGELVIINDRYGIRIDTVHKYEKSEAENKINDMAHDETSKNIEMLKDNQHSDTVEDDDLNDFDIDDEDEDLEDI